MTDATELMLERRRLLDMPLLAAAVPLLGGAAGLFAQLVNAAPPADTANAPKLKAWRMYDGKDGKAHFRQEDLQIQAGGLQSVAVKHNPKDAVAMTAGSRPIHYFSGACDVTLLSDPPRAKGNPFHYATRQALVYVLQGVWEFQVTDGTTMVVKLGEFYWVADNSPECGGHHQRVVGPEWGIELAMFLPGKADPI